MKRDPELFVVLGMHRSGTSALTRALEVLGVALGDELYGAEQGNNDKGFFENIELNELDEELLARLRQSWDCVAPLSPVELMSVQARRFHSRALGFLRDRLSQHASFGIKDPRVSRLLPFWQPLFTETGATTHYLVALRHPLSVARSLAKRDGFIEAKSLLLWREHMLSAMWHTRGLSRVVVDFDLLLAEPERQLWRIAERTGREFDPGSVAFQVYRDEFLEEGLRHARHAGTDLDLLVDAPEGVADLYRLLTACAADEVSAEQEFAVLQDLQATQARDVALLRAFDDLDSQLCAESTRAKKISLEAETKVAAYAAATDAAVAQAEMQRNALHQQMTQQSEERAQLQTQLGELHAERERLRLREVELSGDSQRLAAELRLQSLMTADRGERLAELSARLAESERLLRDVQQNLSAVYGSRSWRLTSPLRALARLGRRR